MLREKYDKIAECLLSIVDGEAQAKKVNKQLGFSVPTKGKKGEKE